MREGRGRIDMIYTEPVGKSESYVQVEPLGDEQLWYPPSAGSYLGSEKFKSELKTVSRNLNAIRDKQVVDRIILVPHRGKRPLRRKEIDKIAAELQGNYGQGVKVKFVVSEHSKAADG